MKHIFSSSKRFFQKALSQESAIVLLAFISTTLVFGFIVYNYVSSLPDYGSVKAIANSMLLYYDDGRVWRIIVPVQVLGNNTIDFRPDKMKISLSIGDGSSTRFVNISGTRGYDVYDNIVLLGDIKTALRSCIISVEYHRGEIVEELQVNLHVYLDEHGRLHVIVDDDNDGVIDSTYLVAFTEDRGSDVSLSLDETYVLSVEKNSVVPIKLLKYMLAQSIKPDARIRVIDSNNSYYTIYVANIAKSLRELVVLASISKGNTDYYLSSTEAGSIIILIPEFFELKKNDRITLAIYLPNTHPISGEIIVPQNLEGKGLLVLSGLKSSDGR